MTQSADRERALRFAQQKRDYSAPGLDEEVIHPLRNLSRAYIEVVGENERLRDALHPGPQPIGVFERGGDGTWWSVPAGYMSDAERRVAGVWCEKSNRYEQLTGLRVDTGEKS